MSIAPLDAEFAEVPEVVEAVGPSGGARSVLAWLRAAAGRLDMRRVDEERRLPSDFARELGERGLFGLCVPVRHGGIGLSIGDTLGVIEQVAALDVALAAQLTVHHTALLTVLHHATPELRDEWLPQLASGRRRAALSLTEAGAGSNPRALSAVAVPDGMGGWRLDGEKTWCGGAAEAGLFTLFARVIEGPRRGITAFAVPAESPGLLVQAPIDTLGVRHFGISGLTLRDVHVPAEALVGEVGQGMTVADEALALGRLATGAIAVGVMKRAVQMMVRYASRRSIGTGLLLENAVTRAVLDESLCAVTAVDALAAALAAEMDGGRTVPTEALLVCKVAGSELAWRAADRLVQMLGARGYDERNGAARLLRDVRFLRIGEGPTEALQMQLGAALLNEDLPLREFLASRLGATETVRRLDAAVRAVRGTGARWFPTPQAALEWEWFTAGSLGMWAVLEAASRAADGDDDRARATAWARRRFEAELRDATTRMVDDAPRSVEALVDTAARYARAIGGLDETNGVAPTGCDPLLCADDPATAPTGPRPLTARVGSPRAGMLHGAVTADAWRTAAHRLFEEQVGRTPDAIALMTPDESLQYAELDRRANRLASALVAAGAGRGARVGVCTGRTFAHIVGTLGALKAGAAFVPINAAHPAERLRQIAEVAGVAIVVTDHATRAAVAAVGAPTLCLDADAEWIASFDDARPADAAAESDDWRDPAYVVFTSGSTGVPKGVIVSHGALCNQLLWRRNELGIGAADRVLHAAAPGFDIAVWESLGPLAAGAAIVLSGQPHTDWDAEEVLQLVAMLGVTAIQVVPSQLTGLLASPRVTEAAATLRLVVSGGESLPRALQRWCFAALPGAVLYNLYGPAEAAIDTTFWRCDPADLRATAPIGHVVSNQRVYVLDEMGAPVSSGVAGELHVAGIGLADGYVGDPDLTARRFVPDPFAGVPGARMYRTGDLVRCTDDGLLAFIGRVDRQVKLRGVRVELGEVEAALLEHPSVSQVAVAAREHRGDKRLVAFVVLSQGGLAAPRDVRRFARERLPRALVPAAVIVVDALPMTASGKVDYRALPAVDWEHADVAPTGDAPSAASRIGAVAAAVTAAVTAVWQEVLGVATVEAHTDFFDCGGHSLLGARVLARVRDLFGVEVSLREFLAEPTVAALAATIERRRTGAEGPRADGVARQRGPGPLPLSAAQQRIWYLQQLHPDSGAYNVPEAVRVRGTLDVARMERALGVLSARHEALRTIFPTGPDGAPVQTILAPQPVAIRVEAPEGVDPAAREAAARSALEAEARRPFDLARERPLRAVAYRLTPDDHLLLWVFHHVAVDGWSVGSLFVRELGEVYDALATGRAPALPRVEMQPADYEAWQAAHLLPARRDAELAFWARTLRGAPDAPALPYDRPHPAARSFRGGRVFLHISGEELAGLRTAARRAGVTLHGVLTAAFGALLARYSGDEDILIGTPVAGRHHPAVENAMGNLANMVTVRCDLSGDPTLADALRRTGEATLAAVEHGHVPFDEVVGRLPGVRDPRRNPVFHVAVALYNGAMDTLRLTGLVAEPVPLDPGTSAFDLTAAFFESATALGGFLEYSADVFDRETIERMATAFGRVLSGFAMCAEGPLSALDVLGDEERARLRVWSDGGPTSVVTATVPEQFRVRAAATPDAVAVSCDSGSDVTYGALARQVEWLARALVHRGVGPEVRVAFCLERSAMLVVAMLGVLEARGAYVPLDSAYPDDRLRYLLADAAPAVIVTERALAERVVKLAGGAAIVCLDELLDAPLDAPLVAPAAADPAPKCIAPAPTSAAYVLYTSGSTGQPKGVVVSHAALAGTLSTYAALLGTGSGDTVAALASVSFDVAGLEVLLPLIVGARVSVLCREVVRDPVALARALDATAPTLVTATPATFEGLLAAGWRGGYPGFRLLVGGDALRAAIADALTHCADACWNAYGPTEATIDATWQALDGSEHVGASGIVSLGRPLPGSTVHVLDGMMRQAPVGVPGELYIGGRRLARGYLHRAELTAARFVPDPFSSEPDARLYRTGDRVRWTPGGQLDFLGRVDFQVKVRGVRIECGEVEAALREAAGVRDALVMLREDRPGDPSLVAYVVPEPDVDESLSPAALRRQLARRLPAPAVPAAVVVLDAFPLSPNGKVDRRALPPAPLTSDATAPDDVPPRNEVESRLAAIWSELLGHPVPGVHASFFDLGGHSLLAARLVASINRAFDASLPLSAIYEDGGTIDAVARQLLTDDGSAGRAGRLLVSLGARASSGSEAPLLLVHPTSGSASCYLPLARALGGTVVGVQSAAFVGADDVPETIEAMARRYAAAVRAEYGGAPVRLGGWSFGGLVALETARLLEAAGIVVEQLILLDAPAPGSARTREGSVRLSFRHMLDDLAARAGTVRTLSDESLAHLSLARLEDAVRREVRRLTALGAALDDPRDDVLDDAFADRLVRACATNAAAMLRYVPEAYTIAAPVLWVLAGAEPAGVEERALWCARTVGGLETRTVADAVHATLLEPLHVDGVARIVAACATCVDEPLVGVGR